MNGLLLETPKDQLEAGKYYWWVLPHGGVVENPEEEFDKFCVVRVYEHQGAEDQKFLVVNCSFNLEIGDDFFLSTVSGKFFGPVPLPDYSHVLE